MGLNLNKIKVTTSNRVKQELLEEATYPCRVVQVIDLGMQAMPAWKGVEKAPRHKVHVTYELLDEFCVDDKGEIDEEKPRWISEEFPLYSLDQENAVSTKRYLALDPNQDEEGDITRLLNYPGLVTVVHNEKKGTTYANVGGLSPMREKDKKKAPELVNPTTVFLLDEPCLDVFNSLPDFLKDKIKGNLEFQGSALQKLIEVGSDEEDNEEEKVSSKKESDEEQEEDGDEPW